MSIILKGIDLPTEDQVIVIHSDGTFNEVDPFARRLMPFYEAIQIPKDHGRLIDGDKIVKEYYINPTYPRLCTALNNAPTILEEEP